MFKGIGLRNSLHPILIVLLMVAFIVSGCISKESDNCTKTDGRWLSY